MSVRHKKYHNFFHKIQKYSLLFFVIQNPLYLLKNMTYAIEHVKSK